MTDNETIKALECCTKNDLAQCSVCPYSYLSSGCRNYMETDALDLINSQKAEIERLKGSVITNNVVEISKIRKTVKSEAIKEFAQRLKEKTDNPSKAIILECGYDGTKFDVYQFYGETIDNLVKEMTEYSPEQFQAVKKILEGENENA